jgi:hypothetical protein
MGLRPLTTGQLWESCPAQDTPAPGPSGTETGAEGAISDFVASLEVEKSEDQSKGVTATDVRGSLEVLQAAGYSVYAPDGEHVMWGPSDRDVHDGEPGWDWTVDLVVKVIDGDTLDLILSRPYERDLGFHAHQRGRDVFGPMRFRLAGIDAPEVRHEPERARAARQAVIDWIGVWPEQIRALRATTHKPSDRPLPDGAFGRWLVSLHDANTGERLADAMRAAGHQK